MQREWAGEVSELNETGNFCRRSGGSLSAVVSLVFILLILGWAYLFREGPFAVYTLSFWHYYLYVLAYRFGSVSLRDFKRDAVSMKSISFVLLGYIYLATPLEAASIIVMAAGFLLNAVAAFALGSDRTYYGYELGAVPPLRITSFPYSYVSHPMLVGNMTAFAGTLLNAEFRHKWWPLAIIHVILNGGLLLMELYVPPRRKAGTGLATCAAGWPLHPPSIISAVLASVAIVYCWGSPTEAVLPKLGMGVCAIVYSYVLYRCYVPRKRDSHPNDDCPQKGIL